MSDPIRDPSLVEVEHPRRIMLSYGSGYLISDFMGAVLGVMLFAFYETEVGLNTLLTGAALVIFAVWDAVNDPIVGYFSDRPHRFTERWGRRFPLIVGSFIPMIATFVLIFYPPTGAGEWGVFAWLVATTCLFDVFESVFVTNFYGLFPDKFRKQGERITTSSISTGFVIGGVVIGSVLPPMVIVFGELNTWVLMAWISVAVCTVVFPFIIPGVRDDRESVEAFLRTRNENTEPRLLPTLLGVLRQRNLLMYLLLILVYFTLTNSMAGSFLYYAEYVLGESEGDVASYFLATMFGAALISIPLWLIYAKRTNNNKRIMLIGGTILATTAMVFSFLDNLTLLYSLFIIMGTGVGGFLILMNPAFGDVVDESIVTSGARNEALLGGFRFFMANLSRVLMAVILTVVHTVTGFVEGSDTQTAAAVTGIRLHAGLIPALFMAAGLVFFWRYYDLTPQRTRAIRSRLETLDT